MMKTKPWKKICCCSILSAAMVFCVFGYVQVRNAIPDTIRVLAGEEQEFRFHVPVLGETVSPLPRQQVHFNFNEPIIIEGTDAGSFTIDCKLFGLFDIKNVQVDIVKQQSFHPGGFLAGIYVETEGVLVIGSGTVTGMDGMEYEPACNIVKSGDYIVSVNGQEVRGKAGLVELVGQCGGNDIVLGVRRNGALTQLSLKPVEYEPGRYKLGIWVRDNAVGIGTLTFMDENGAFGALGHGINDVDTGTLMEIRGGKLYETEVVFVKKGENGVPGELTGVVEYSGNCVLGEIRNNTPDGIYGQVYDVERYIPGAAPLPLGMKQDVKPGPAKIRCSVDNVPREFDVEILEVYPNANDNKGIVLEVTDQELMGLTGGIVQGMSGSPIIQDGKLVGAVTHVFVQNARRGFGIFIENMMGH